MRTLIKFFIIVVIALGLIIGGAYLYLFKWGGIEKIVNNRIASLVGTKYKLDIKVGKISGNIYSTIDLKDITVYYDDSLNRYQIMKIPSLETSYSLKNLWHKKYILNYLKLDSAVITLIEDSTGSLIIPNLLSKKTQQHKNEFLFSNFAIGEIDLSNFQLKLLREKDTIKFNDINISLAFKGEDNTFGIDVKKFEFASNKKKLVLNTAGGKITLTKNNLVFKDVSLVSNDTRMKLDGNINFSPILTGDVTFAVDNLVLFDVTSYFGIKLDGKLDLNGNVAFKGWNLNGSVDVGGKLLMVDFKNLFVNFRYLNKQLLLDTLYGTILGNCSVDGNGMVDFSQSEATYQLNTGLKQFNLNKLVANSFESNLNGHLSLEGKSFHKKSMILYINTNLYESSFDNYPLQKALGSMIVTTDSIILNDPFKINYYENIFSVSGKIGYKDNMSLKVDAQLKNLDRYKGKLFLDQPGGRGYAEAVISGKTSDPDLNGYLVSDSLWLYGFYSDSVYAGVNIKRFLSGKKGEIKVNCYNGEAWKVPYDTGYVFITVDSNLLYFDTTYFKNRFSWFKAQGTYNYEAYPSYLHIDTLTLSLFNQTFYNRLKIDVDVDSLGFVFNQVAIGNNGTKFSTTGRTNFDETMDMKMSVSHLPIEPWKNLFAESLLVDGTLSCEASLKGSFSQPQFSINATVDSLMYQNLLLGRLSTNLKYADKRLSIDSLTIFSDPGLYRAYGFFYIDLAFTSGSFNRLPDSSMEINIKATDKRFDLVSLLLPSVELLEGDFFADFVLSGTPHHPHLKGVSYIKNAWLKYFDLEDPIYSDSAGVIMKDNKIIVDSLVTYVYEKRGKKKGNKRYAYIKGDITVKSLSNFYYNLDVDISKDFPFSYELEDIYGKLEGSLHIEGDTPPLVTGDVTIISMKYLVNFAEPEEGSPIMAALSSENTWDLDINVDIPSNYWIKNDDIDAEFSGEMNLIRENGVYRFIGEMDILRGRGFLFDKTFNLEPGGKVIFEGSENFNPTLDIIGYTHIVGTKRSLTDKTETSEQLKLGIHMTGTLEKPQINITEDSDFSSREDILPLIVANYSRSDSTSASGSFEQRMADLISSQVSQIGSRQLGRLGVETFEIDPYYTGVFDPLATRVTFGFYTSQNFYIYGRSALSGQNTQEVGFEYRLKKSLLIQGLRDENELYHLNLKFNWEF